MRTPNLTNEQENSSIGDPCGSEDPTRPPSSPIVEPVGHSRGSESTPDVVEQALAAALEKATAAGDLDAVKMLVDELRARREARAGVVVLDVERRRRER